MSNSTHDQRKDPRGVDGTNSERTATIPTHQGPLKGNTDTSPSGFGVSVTEFIQNRTIQKVRLMERFPNLADSDFQAKPGKQDEQVLKLESKPGRTRDELFAFIKTI